MGKSYFIKRWIDGGLRLFSFVNFRALDFAACIKGFWVKEDLEKNFPYN